MVAREGIGTVHILDCSTLLLTAICFLHCENDCFFHADDIALDFGRKLENCTKPVTRELMKKLKFDNLLGLDENLRNGNLKTGKMNAEILETKRQFPHEILMYRCWFSLSSWGFWPDTGTFADGDAFIVCQYLCCE